MDARTLGVEEELFLVEPDTGRLAAVARGAVRAGDDEDAEVSPELFLQMIETSTPPCRTADDLAEELRKGRRALGEAARAAGARAVAVPAPVLPTPERPFTPKSRYGRIAEEYGEIARQALVCAMHVHVEVADDAEAVGVVDAVRPWLPALLALSANSPFWQGRDTGHASWRSRVWCRWPRGGPNEPFGTPEAYRAAAEEAVAWGGALDAGMLYYDVRLAEDYPTVEIRVADVCTDPEDAVLVGLLTRALVETEARAWRQGTPPADWRTDQLRLATWRAARDGLSGSLVHPTARRLVPAAEACRALLEHVRDALVDAGDLARVEESLDRLLRTGGGAARQRAAAGPDADLTAVVADLVRRTEESWA